jgi:hemolysin activation/secretion protein
MRHQLSSIVVLALCGASLHAQTIPDAGALMRQNEQMFRQDQMQRNQPKRTALPPAMVINDDTLITVQQFKFNGNKILSSGQLQAVAEPFANRALNQHDLQQLTHAISEAYRQTGWLVQAYIPRQSLKNNELELQVIESIPPNKSSQ